MTNPLRKVNSSVWLATTPPAATAPASSHGSLKPHAEITVACAAAESQLFVKSTAVGSLVTVARSMVGTPAAKTGMHTCTLRVCT